MGPSPSFSVTSGTPPIPPPGGGVGGESTATVKTGTAKLEGHIATVSMEVTITGKDATGKALKPEVRTVVRRFSMEVGGDRFATMQKVFDEALEGIRKSTEEHVQERLKNALKGKDITKITAADLLEGRNPLTITAAKIDADIRVQVYQEKEKKMERVGEAKMLSGAAEAAETISILPYYKRFRETLKNKFAEKSSRSVNQFIQELKKQTLHPDEAQKALQAILAEVTDSEGNIKAQTWFKDRFPLVKYLEWTSGWKQETQDQLKEDIKSAIDEITKETEEVKKEIEAEAAKKKAAGAADAGGKDIVVKSG